MVKRVGILYHPFIEAARNLAAELEKALASSQVEAWPASAWEENEARVHMPGTDLVLSLGGDGTILRVARAVVPWPVPILGVNMGRLGFIAELTPRELRESLPAFLTGEGWLEERAMLQAELLRAGEGAGEPLNALNDVVVGRASVSRLAHIRVHLDGEPLADYRADGVIVATATGSTGYSLSAGGPILHPQAREMVLQPIAAHLNLPVALVLPPIISIELELLEDREAMLSLDGQVEIPLKSGDRVRVQRSPHLTRFLRFRHPSFFYRTLAQRLTSRCP